MPISCHFQDCKALLVLKKHVRSAIASTWTLPLPLPNAGAANEWHQSNTVQITRPICNIGLYINVKQVIWAKLTRRAKAYISSCSQVILVYIHPFRRNSLFCRQKSPKNHVKSIFLAFKVIDVDKFKKPVTSACYDKQHVCAYLQPGSRYTR